MPNKEINIVRDIDLDQLQLITDLLPDGIMLFDSNGRICFANKIVINLFGYSFMELLGKEVEMLIPQRYHERHVHSREQFRKNLEVRSMNKLICKGITKSGKELNLGIMLRPLLEEGDYCSVFCVIRELDK